MANVPIPFQGIPADIEHHRQMMFLLEHPVHFTPVVYEKYFPFVDNVWCLHDSKGTVSYKSGVETLRGACRLHRKPETKGTSLASNRKRREGTGTCNAKFKMLVMPDGTRVLERFGNTPHSHDLDYIDSIKRNSVVRQIVLHEYFKSWDAAAILAYLRDPAQKVNDKDLLREAGGHYINRNEISNIMTRALKKAYPGQDPFEVKRQQDKYKTYKSCSIKGCMAAPFATAKELTTHKRGVHGLQKHDHSGKLPCPDPNCSRRKQSRGFTSVTALQEHQRRYHGVEPDPNRHSADESAGARGPQNDEGIRHAIVEEAERDDANIGRASDSSISAPARRHMEDRLALMEKERVRLDAEIAALREKLYGDEASNSADALMADGAGFEGSDDS